MASFNLFCEICKAVDRKTCTCSKYQQTRNANLVRNKEMMRSLGFCDDTIMPIGKSKRSAVDHTTAEESEVALHRRNSLRSNDSQKVTTHARFSTTKMSKLSSVECKNCGQKIWNPKNINDDELLRWHAINSTSCSSRMLQESDSLVFDMPIGATFSAFEEGSDDGLFFGSTQDSPCFSGSDNDASVDSNVQSENDISADVAWSDCSSNVDSKAADEFVEGEENLNELGDTTLKISTYIHYLIAY